MKLAMLMAVVMLLVAPALAQTAEQSAALAQDWDALDKSVDALHGAKAHVSKSLGEYVRAIQIKDEELKKIRDELELWKKASFGEILNLRNK